MKWVIRIVGFLVAAAVFTLLKTTDAFVAVGSVGTGLITAAVFFLGVYFIPGRIIRRMEAKQPPAPEAPPADAPEEICAYPMMKQAAAPEAQREAAPAPTPAEPKRKERRPYNSGYILVIVCLSIVLILSWLNSSSKSNTIDKLRSDVADSYNDGYNDGWAEGENHGIDVGYDAGYLAAQKEYRAPVFPYNGEVFSPSAYEQTCPFTVNTTPASSDSFTAPATSGSNYYIRLEYITSDELSLAEGHSYHTSIYNGASYSRSPKNSGGIILPSIGDDISFYVCKGCAVDIDVPPGIYRLWYCCGTDWYGEKYYFGDDTQWYSADELLLFYTTSTDYVGNTITLYKTADGNFSTYEVDADDVPF